MTDPASPLEPPADPSRWKLPRIRVTRDGEWLHEGEEVSHPGILSSLRDGLRVDDAGHYVEVGPVRVPVEVDDAPFVVVRVEREGTGLVLTLDDLSREALDVATLSFGADGVPHCRVKQGRFLGRWSRAATHQLLALVEPGTPPVLVLGSARHPLAGYVEREPG